MEALLEKGEGFFIEVGVFLNSRVGSKYSGLFG